MITMFMGPDDKIVVNIDWSGWLGDSAIASATWSDDDSVLTYANQVNTETVSTAYISIASGVEDDYWVRNTITTADAVARIESRSFRLRVARKEIR